MRFNCFQRFIYDGENQPDILSIIASSAALAISGLPFQGPIVASRVDIKMENIY